ncbi:hypothetical protein [Anaerosporobacter sp.]
MAAVDLEVVFQKFDIKNVRLRRFLYSLQVAFVSKDYELADEIIRDLLACGGRKLPNKK